MLSLIYITTNTLNLGSKVVSDHSETWGDIWKSQGLKAQARKSWPSTGLERPNELVDLIWLSCYSWADTRREGEGENSNWINIPGGRSLPSTEKAVGAAVQASLLDMMPQGHPQTHSQGSSLEEKSTCSCTCDLAAYIVRDDCKLDRFWARGACLSLNCGPDVAPCIGAGLGTQATSSSTKKYHFRLPSAGDITFLGKSKTLLWSGCCLGRINVWYALAFELGPVFLLSFLCPDVLNLLLHSRCTSLSEYWPHLHSHRDYFVVIR